ncbi:MAG: META domain-containing protein, partial [Gemmatimonadota bacterium]
MKHECVLLLAALIVPAACAPVESDVEPDGIDTGSAQRPVGGSPDSAGYRAGGNEPFWTLTFGETTMDFADMGSTTTASADRPDAESLANGWRFTASADGRPFVVEIQVSRCNDSMSGRPFPHSVTVTVHGRTWTGCGGDTASLLTGQEWSVTHLEGVATSSQRQPTLSFAAAGALTGDGGCNQYRATYEITGEGIDIGPALATRRACAEPELNRQETQFFQLLEQVTRFDIAGDGSLEL